MGPKPKTVVVPDVLYRVAIASRGLSFARIDPVDAAMPAAGNRFDVPGGGVLYCGTTVEGCYRETLARLRPSPRAVSLDEDSDNRFMRAGSIPTSWRDARRIFRVSLDDPAPFLDVESPETRAHLDSALSSLITDHLDVSDVRGRNRMLTRAIAEWAYTQVDGDGDGVYSGIRYMSRHGDYECWAIFSGTSVREAGPATAIELTDPDLIRVARSFALTIN